MTATAGFIAILVSTLGFGSNYVPVKRCVRLLYVGLC